MEDLKRYLASVPDEEQEDSFLAALQDRLSVEELAPSAPENFGMVSPSKKRSLESGSRLSPAEMERYGWTSRPAENSTEYSEAIDMQLRSLESQRRENELKNDKIMAERQGIKKYESNPFDQILGAMVPLAVGFLGGEAGALSQGKAFDNYRGYLKEEGATKQNEYERLIKENDLRLRGTQTERSRLANKKDDLMGDGAFKAITLQQQQANKDQDFSFKREKLEADSRNSIVKGQEKKTKEAENTKKAGFKDASMLRREFFGKPQVKNFKEIRSSYDKLQSLKKNPTAVTDLGVIFAYMKLLDPPSTVRESEAATAENARGVPATIRNLQNKILEGRKLEADQIKNFINASGALFNAQLLSYNDEKKIYDDLAVEYGVDPGLVTGSVQFEEKGNRINKLKKELELRNKKR